MLKFVKEEKGSRDYVKGRENLRKKLNLKRQGGARMKKLFPQKKKQGE